MDVSAAQHLSVTLPAQADRRHEYVHVSCYPSYPCLVSVAEDTRGIETRPNVDLSRLAVLSRSSKASNISYRPLQSLSQAANILLAL